MGDGLTSRQADEISSSLREINKRLGNIEVTQGTHSTMLSTAIARSAEDRSRITILEDNVEDVSKRVSLIEERQKIGTILQGAASTLLAIVAAWFGATR